MMIFYEQATILGYQIEKTSGSVIYKNNYCWNSVFPFCFIVFCLHTEIQAWQNKIHQNAASLDQLRRYKIVGCIEKASRKIWGNNNARYRKKVVENAGTRCGSVTSICTFSNKVWSGHVRKLSGGLCLWLK